MVRLYLKKKSIKPFTRGSANVEIYGVCLLHYLSFPFFTGVSEGFCCAHFVDTTGGPGDGELVGAVCQSLVHELFFHGGMDDGGSIIVGVERRGSRTSVLAELGDFVETPSAASALLANLV